MGLRRICADVRYLGSYERHDGKAPTIRPGTTDEEFNRATEWLARLRDGA
jgi:prephenate dehydratase